MSGSNPDQSESLRLVIRLACHCQHAAPADIPLPFTVPTVSVVFKLLLVIAVIVLMLLLSSKIEKILLLTKESFCLCHICS